MSEIYIKDKWLYQRIEELEKQVSILREALGQIAYAKLILIEALGQIAYAKLTAYHCEDIAKQALQKVGGEG